MRIIAIYGRQQKDMMLFIRHNFFSRIAYLCNKFHIVLLFKIEIHVHAPCEVCHLSVLETQYGNILDKDCYKVYQPKH